MPACSCRQHKNYIHYIVYPMNAIQLMQLLKLWSFTKVSLGSIRALESEMVQNYLLRLVFVCSFWGTNPFVQPPNSSTNLWLPRRSLLSCYSFILITAYKCLDKIQTFYSELLQVFTLTLRLLT